MKKKYFGITILLYALAFVGCTSDNSIVAADDSALNVEAQQIEDAIASLPKTELSDSAENGLIFMREEEKLARDVYLYFYEKYGMRIFNNIAKSESTHMTAIKMLLDKYELADPVTNDEIGVFQNQDLAALYTQLTEAANVSLLEAVKIGATIEDLDIKDLMEYSAEIESEDILLVYNNLTKGSRNHLRSFYSRVLQYGGTYEPQFISQELFDLIISSPKERGSW
ncbi:MAG: DUF2202 domain-containing protein [Bacteroidetes bacterium]|nr:DUF2202 domain-containing protein [Bacteroidota bacterium]MBU1114691.1 DUF2202 domain-containing protein [Bacteroidota bacterium]MBU1798893.1 DUF2202 domain-containing protein [Bacteroidota bacterium]